MKIVKNDENPNDFFNKLVATAISNDVSDIHINPRRNEEIYIRFRQTGELSTFCMMKPDFYQKLINIIKNNIGIYSSNDASPQDGKINITLKSDKKEIRANLRVSVLPSLYGDNIVIRILIEDADRLNIDKLGFINGNLEQLKETKDLKNGLVLVSGSTGAGKTTTLYSLLGMFDPNTKSIYTIEDPIEYQIDGYIQSQLKHEGSEEDYQINFGKRIKGLLRQDPDIILVGEIRDKEGASICLEASNTGHVVFGSVHANNALGVIARLKQLGVKPYLISSGLKCIVYQKLVKKLCPICKIEKDMTYYEDFKKDLNKIIELPGIKGGEILLHQANPEGCENCHSGYKGVTLISEVMGIDDKIAQLIFDNKSIYEIKNYLNEKGFSTIFEDAIIKSAQGLVDITDVLAHKD